MAAVPKRSAKDDQAPAAKEKFSFLKARIRGRPEPVEIANVPPDGLGVWMMQELAGFDPTYLFLTVDGERIPVTDIASLLLDSGERTFEPVLSREPTPFRAIAVRLGNTGELVRIANIPETEAGIQLVRRLRAADGRKDRASYAQQDFLATDLGWRPIRQIDPARIPFDPSTSAPVPLADASEIADGTGYDPAPLPVGRVGHPVIAKLKARLCRRTARKR